MGRTAGIGRGGSGGRRIWGVLGRPFRWGGEVEVDLDLDLDSGPLTEAGSVLTASGPAWDARMRWTGDVVVVPRF